MRYFIIIIIILFAQVRTTSLQTHEGALLLAADQPPLLRHFTCVNVK